MQTLRTITLLTLLGTGLFFLFARIKSAKEYSIIQDLNPSETIIPQPDSVRNAIALNNLIFSISTLEKLETGYIGFAGRKSTQLDYFTPLQKWADTNQLLKLTDHGNALVRSMAFRALKNKGYTGLKKIFEKHLYDDQAFQVYSGCVTEPFPVNADLYQCIYPLLTVSEANFYKKKLIQQYKGTYFEHMFWYP